MIVEAKVREFICTTAHPIGCRENVRRQIAYIKERVQFHGKKKVLVIGASTGYGLASRITMAFGAGAATLGVMFEKEAAKKRTATPGWYNTKALEEFAKEEGLYAESLNGDAFSEEVKERVIEKIQKELGYVDLVIYSLAAPRRTTEEGITYHSVLKTCDKAFTEKSWNLRSNQISEATIAAASQEEIESTIKVMGGEDWYRWIQVLDRAGVLAKDAVTVAYSYIGPELTYPVYYHGTIGMAKKNLEEFAGRLNQEYGRNGLKAYISVNKALVTQASSAIPIVPLYFAILYKVMKQAGTHEGCIEQMGRLFGEKLFGGNCPVDSEGRIRMDDYEMEAVVQQKVMEIWNRVTTENLLELADVEGYWEDFYHMFGFRFENVDYTADVEI